MKQKFLFLILALVWSGVVAGVFAQESLGYFKIQKTSGEVIAVLMDNSFSMSWDNDSVSFSNGTKISFDEIADVSHGENPSSNVKIVSEGKLKAWFADGTLIVKSDKPLGLVSVRSLVGALIMQRDIKEAEMRYINNLPKGVYIVTISDKRAKTGSKSLKVVKN